MSEQPLPTVDPLPAGDVPPPPREVEVSSVRLVATLAVAGAIAGLAIVMVFQWANPRIQRHRAEVLKAAVQQVLSGPARSETVFLEDGRFTLQPQSDTAKLDRIYVGYDADGNPVGVAIAAAEPGFQDVIDLIFGYDPGAHRVLGMTVLDSKETPGLGDKITKDSAFISEFNGVTAPLIGVKRGQAKGKDTEVEMITGATISSRAVIRIINDRLEEIGDAVDAFWASPAARGAGGTADGDDAGAGGEGR